MSFWILLLLHLCVVVGLGWRVLTRQRPTSSKLAWILVLLDFPAVGALLYLLIGERFIGARRTRRIGAAHERIRDWTQALVEEEPPAEENLHPAARRLGHLTASWGHPAPVAGNAVEFIATGQETFERLLADIRAAQRTCHLEFYIAYDHGCISDILDALAEAAARGVSCRLLLDALGSRRLVGSGRVRALERQGVEVRASLPFGRLRRLGARLDLRNHRKVVVIDSAVAYVGSLNLVDPDFVEREWDEPPSVDAMVRVRGPAVSVLASGFLADWILEGEDEEEEVLPAEPPPRQNAVGDVPVQVIATGPTSPPERLLQLLISLLHGAQKRIVVCTPYYVPDAAVHTALLTAARAGIEVHLIVPKRADHRFVQWVMESYYADLLDAGVKLFRHVPGFLHTKCVLIDDEISLFGSMNLDMRSVWLNFEVAVLLFDREAGAALRELLLGYEAESERPQLERWRDRPMASRARAQVVRLVAPLL